MTALSDLIARLEAAKEGSRELDFYIISAFVGDKNVVREIGNEAYGCFWDVVAKTFHAIPRYTSSFDAARTIIPKGWGFSVHGSPPEHNCCQSASLMRGDPPYFDSEEIEATAQTSILALCIAALKAREAAR